MPLAREFDILYKESRPASLIDLGFPDFPEALGNSSSLYVLLRHLSKGYVGNSPA
jgi:hypothetical protein